MAYNQRTKNYNTNARRKTTSRRKTKPQNIVIKVG